MIDSGSIRSQGVNSLMTKADTCCVDPGGPNVDCWLALLGSLYGSQGTKKGKSFRMCAREGMISWSFFGQNESPGCLGMARAPSFQRTITSILRKSNTNADLFRLNAQSGVRE